MAKPNSRWYRLDNAGILYSALQKEEYSAIYRFSALMEKDDGPAAVGERVNDLDGNTVPVIVKPHEPAVILPEADGLAGIGHVLLQKRARRTVRL